MDETTSHGAGAPEPHDEMARRAALYSLGLLDTGAEERFDRLTRLAQRYFDVPIALVSLVDADRQWFKSEQGLGATETPREHAFCAWAILDDETVVVNDATEDPRFVGNPLVQSDPNIRFYAGRPITAPDGHRVGTLCIIDNEPREIDDKGLSALDDFAALVEKEMARTSLAVIDDLTGLMNRLGFDRVGAQVLSAAGRMDRPSTLVYLDLDGLKAINDEQGHQAGDEAIRDFAELLKTTFRGSDVIARVGGDEFAVVFTGSDEEEARLAVQRLRNAIDGFNRDRRRPYELGASIGMARSDGERPTVLEQLTAVADERMYQEKRTKRSSRSSDPIVLDGGEDVAIPEERRSGR